MSGVTFSIESYQLESVCVCVCVCDDVSNVCLWLGLFLLVL